MHLNWIEWNLNQNDINDNWKFEYETNKCKTIHLVPLNLLWISTVYSNHNLRKKNYYYEKMKCYYYYYDYDYIKFWIESIKTKWTINQFYLNSKATYSLFLTIYPIAFEIQCSNGQRLFLVVMIFVVVIVAQTVTTAGIQRIFDGFSL